MGLAVFILDAVSPGVARSLNMQNLLDIYRQHGDVLTCSGIPHTAPSNSLIWSGVEKYRFWVQYLGEFVPQRRVDPATFFSRSTGEVKTDRVRLWIRSDYSEPFLWELVAAQDLEAVAYDIPVVLPPLRFNADDAPDTDNWFPDSMERCRNHVREFIQYSTAKVAEEPDLYVTSCQYPDKLLHGLGGDFPDSPTHLANEPHPAAQKFVDEETRYLDVELPRLIDTCVESGMDWVVMGDHGPPRPGALPVQDVDGAPFVLPRHQKHSLIATNLDNSPTYTEDLFSWFMDYFGLDVGCKDVLSSVSDGKEEDVEAVIERLTTLGYM